jgi:predicted secreted protein
MNTQLRPLTLGEILDRTAELYRTRFLLFAGISTIFAAAMLVIQFLYLRSLYLLGYPNLMAKWQWSTAVGAVAEVLAIMLLGGLSIVANNRAVAWVYLDQPATIRQAARSVKPHLGRYLWLMTNVALRAWTPIAVLYIAYFVLLFMLLPHDFMTNPAATQIAVQRNPSAFLEFGAGMLILAPLFLAALVYGVIMWLRYSLAVPACVVEELPASKAIKRSVELSAGSRGRIFVLWLLVALVRMLLGLLFGFPIILLAFKHQGQPMPMGWMMLSQVGEFLSNALIGPIYAIGVTLFYYDQRVRKEGFDIEWMMQAAGLTPAPELTTGQQL